MGEHSLEVLAEAGYSASDIARLLQSGTVVGHSD
jgi:hypothetical protein